MIRLNGYIHDVQNSGIHLPHLPPGDGWYIRVSRSSTGNNQLSPSLLTVFPPRPYIKVRGILWKQWTMILLLHPKWVENHKSTFSTNVAGGDMPMVPRAL